jgi:hypothetical protein
MDTTHDTAHTGAPVPEPPAAIVPWLPPEPSPTDVDSSGRVSLWSAGDVGVSSFLFGFPAGLALAARNSYRLGRQQRAAAYLAIGAGLLLVAWVVPTALVAMLNIGIAIYLYRSTGADIEALRSAGRVVGRAGVLGGIATVIGAWAFVFALSFGVAIVLLTADGSPDAADARPMASPSAAATITTAAPPAAVAPSQPVSEPGASDDPDLESKLPETVGGMRLARESWRGLAFFR